MAQPEAFEASLPLIEVLEELHVDYLVGGSLASSYHGTPRSTQDVDLVADLKPAHVPLLIGRLEDRYYMDRGRMLKAVRARTSFNVIFLRTMFKIDVFLLENDPLMRQEMRRRQRVDIAGGARIEVASAEDTVLQKLAWYRKGGDTSSRQWDDVLGVLKVQRKEIDLAYLRRWAPHLEVEDLLARALSDAGIEVDPG